MKNLSTIGQESSAELQVLLNAYHGLPKIDPESQLGQQIGRKSNWQPARYEDTTVHPTVTGAHNAVLKSLAIALALEVPVGEFTLAASRNFKANQQAALYDNATDEIVHFEALNRLALSLDENSRELLSSYTEEALNFQKAILELPESPIVKSGYIELGAFLVLLSVMRRMTNLAKVKLLVQDISLDESVHVATNWNIIDANEIPWTDSRMSGIRRDIVAWCTEDIKVPKWNSEVWLEQSDRLVETRRADGLAFTKRGQTTSFFEISNKSLASY